MTTTSLSSEASFWKVPNDSEFLLKESDNVNHPDHYTSQGVFIEPIDLCRQLPFDLGNACKYLIRAGHKNCEVEDVRKAIWYLNDYYQNFQEIIKNLTVEETNTQENVRVAKFYISDFNKASWAKFFMGLLWFSSINKYICMLFYTDGNSYWGTSLQNLQQTIKQIKEDYKLTE